MAFGSCNVAELGPDEIIAYCKAQLGSFDTRIRESFNAQNQLREISGVLSPIIGKFGASLSDGLKSDHHEFEQVDAGLTKAIELAHATPGAELRAKELRSIRENFREKTHSKDGIVFRDNVKLKTEELREMSTRLEKVQSDCGSDAQAGMLKLQSVMSERQSIIQLCTNLISTFGDSTKAIAQNVGH